METPIDMAITKVRDLLGRFPECVLLGGIAARRGTRKDGIHGVKRGHERLHLSGEMAEYHLMNAHFGIVWVMMQFS